MKILLADDHLLVRVGLQKIIETEEDFECVGVAEDGEKAVDLVSCTCPDVVVIDVVMPKLDGIEVCKRIKNVSNSVGILIISAYKSERLMISALKAGADGYLLKDDMLPETLVGAIRMVALGQKVFDHHVGELVQRHSNAKIGFGELQGFGELTTRETDVLHLIIRGFSNKKIASELGIGQQTVGSHIVNIFRKLDVGSRLEAVLLCLKKGWATVGELPDDYVTDD